MKYCSRCGEPLEKDAMFCGKCGAKVVASTSDDVSLGTDKNKPIKFTKEQLSVITQAEKDITNASNTGIALAWLQTIITIVFFLFGTTGEDLGNLQFGLSDVAFYISFAILTIILSNRIKTTKSIKIRKYLFILLAFTILIVGLSLLGGDVAGILWFIYIFSLIRALSSTSKLKDIQGYFDESKVNYKLKTLHWILFGLFAVIFILFGLIYDYGDDEYTPEEFRSDAISACVQEGGETAYDYCTCAVNYLTNNYSISELEGMSESRLNNLYDSAAKVCARYIP